MPLEVHLDVFGLDRHVLRDHRDYLPALQRELVAVISKYVSIKAEDIKVHFERQDNLEVLEVKIELPESLRG